MNKHLITSLVFAVLCTAFTGCTKSHDMYDPGRDRTMDDAKKVYDKNFTSYVGKINSNVDWGFSKNAKTRGLTRATAPTITLDETYPVTFTPKFMNSVRKYLPEGETPKTDLTSFEFLQNGSYSNLTLIYSNTTANDEVGIYYYDPATETPETAVKYVLINNIQDGLGKIYQKQIIVNRWQDPTTTDGYKVWDNGVLKIHNNFFFIQMDPSYHFGIYVKNADTGKTYYTNKYLNENEEGLSAALIEKDYNRSSEFGYNYVFGLSDDDKVGCELIFALLKTADVNWPIAEWPKVVIPEKKEEPELKWYRIIAEDLNAHDLDADGNSDDTDFDFNDIVLDVALTNDGAKCILQAAGATLKIRINGNDNLEVHKLFNVEDRCMVNTNADKKGWNGATKAPVEFSLAGSFASIDEINIEVFKYNKWMPLYAPKGQAACKIAVGTDFVWPEERESLKAKYPDFLNYVNRNEQIDTWWKNMNIN